MSGWDACTQDPHWLFRQIECHPASVAATQDGLLVLTILVAIGVPACVEYIRHRRRRNGSIAYAVALIIPTIQVQGDISRVRHYIDRLQKIGDDVPALLDVAPKLLLSVPNELASALPELHQFDNYAVQAIRSAIIAVQGSNAIAAKIMQALTEKPEGFKYARANMIALAISALDHVKEQLDRTIGELGKRDKSTT
jgi:hypothetical protein